MRRFLIVLTAVALVLYSCGDTSFFLADEDAPDTVSVLTVNAGTMLAAGDPIPILIQRGPVQTGDPEIPDILTLEILDASGVVLAEHQIQSVDEALELPSAAVPDLIPGLYQVRTTYYDGEEAITTESTWFFITEGLFAISGTSIYPATSLPGSVSLVAAAIAAPLESDPFLVWRLNGEPVQSGLLSEIGSQLQLRAPGVEGVHPVVLELYPSKPDGQENLPAPVTQSAQIVVTNNPEQDRTDLAPQTSYLSLYHFRGNLKDSGARSRWFPTSSFEAQTDAEPPVEARTDIFGYYLDGETALTLPGDLRPILDDLASPFSVSLRLMPDLLDTTRRILAIQNDNGIILEILADEHGHIGTSIDGENWTWSSRQMVASQLAGTITLSFDPLEDTTVLTMFADGYLVDTQVIPGQITVNSATSSRGPDGWSVLPGTTILAGGSDEHPGFRGIVDELGIYFRDEQNRPSADTGVYHSAMEALHGESLLYAEGFEAGVLPADLETSGDVSVEAGAMVIPAGARVTFPVFEFGFEDLVFEAGHLSDGISALRFYEVGAEQPLADLSVNDTVGGYALIVARVTHGDETIVLELGDQGGTYPLSRSDFPGLQVEAVAPSGKGELIIRNVLVRTEKPRIPGGILDDPES